MRFLRFVAALGIVTLVHFLGVRVLPDFSLMVDLFLVVVVLYALGGDALVGLGVGTAAGLAQDALAGGPYGLHAFAGTLVGYTTARVAQRLIIQRASAVLLTVLVATIAQQAILFGLIRTLMPDRHQASPIWWLVKGLAGGLVAFAFHAGRASLLQTRERVRRERVEKLRIER